MKEKKHSNYEMDRLDEELQNLPDERTYQPQKRQSGQRSEGQKKGEGPRENNRKKSVQEKPVREKPLSERRARKEQKAREKEEAKKKKMTNKEFARVTYMFVTLFLVMIGYMVYFNVVKSKEVINSPYNVRQDLLAKRVVRGKILDCNGEVLAQTVTDEDGTETREYPYDDLYAHVVGYYVKGKYGIESIQNFNLLTSNAFFLEKLAKEFKGEKNIGDNVVTTLDTKLQQAAYNALGNNKGAVVVMEASTGKILAMVSKPTFDANTVAENWEALNNDPDSSLFNRATMGQYTPGSTFKIVTTLEYLREHPDADDAYTHYCEGSIEADGTTIHCYGQTAHGQEDLAYSVANSCNTSFSNIGLQLDKDKWKKTTEDLLFDKKLPCDLSYRESSFRLTGDSDSAETMMTAIGQGKTVVTPYHMAMITAAIANGGTLMKPYLVDQITNYTGTTVKKYMPEKYADLMTSAEAAQLTEYMTDVVNYGTGTALSGESYTVAGKTGTAEVSVDKQTVHSWFVGFSNVDNPDIVVSAVVENADTASITGTSVAKKIFNAYYYQ